MCGLVELGGSNLTGWKTCCAHPEGLHGVGKSHSFKTEHITISELTVL